MASSPQRGFGQPVVRREVSALPPEASYFLDQEMASAIHDAQRSLWSHEGQVLFIRNRMDAAYVRVRNALSAEGWEPSDQ